MIRSDAFFDSNVLLYLVSADATKAALAERLLSQGGVVSFQVLIECTSVALRKFKMPWAEVEELLGAIESACQIVALQQGAYERGLRIARRYGFSIFDSMVVGAALEASCTVLYSEDMQNGQQVESLVIRNPFVI